MAFGAAVDTFGILDLVAGAGQAVLGEVLELISSSGGPIADSRADALDENNDIAATTFYGAGTVSEVSTTFALTSGTLDTADLLLGEIEAGLCITSIELSTSNDGWPQLVVSGSTGLETMVEPTGGTNKYDMPSYTLTARKQAQLIGFTVGATGKLTGSSLSASVELAQQEDAGGEPVAHGVSGGTLEVSADFVSVTGTPTWIVTAPLIETQAINTDSGQAAYQTATGTAAGTLTRDV